MVRFGLHLHQARGHGNRPNIAIQNQIPYYHVIAVKSLRNRTRQETRPVSRPGKLVVGRFECVIRLVSLGANMDTLRFRPGREARNRSVTRCLLQLVLSWNFSAAFILLLLTPLAIAIHLRASTQALYPSLNHALSPPMPR